MVKRQNIIRMIASLMLLCCVFSACGKMRSDIYIKTKQLEEYSQNHEEFTLQDVYGDIWDVAYLDPMNYGNGGYIRWKYGLEFEVESEELGDWLSNEMQRCIFFFKDNQLIFTVVTEILPRSLEVIYPDTILYREDGADTCGYYDKRTMNHPLSIDGNTEDACTDAIRNDPITSKYVEYGKNGNAGNGLPLNQPFQMDLNEKVEWSDGVHITLCFKDPGSIVEITVDMETGVVETIERFWPERPILMR